MADKIQLPDLPPNKANQLKEMTALRKLKEMGDKYGGVGKRWMDTAITAAKQNNLPVYYITDIINRENAGWQPALKAKGSTATGLGQFVSSTAKHLNIDPTNPEQSIHGVARYLSEIRDQLGTDNFSDLTKAYVLGPGGYRQYQKTGKAVGSEQIPSVEKFLANAGYNNEGGSALMSVLSKPDFTSQYPADVGLKGLLSSMMSKSEPIQQPKIIKPDMSTTQQRLSELELERQQQEQGALSASI